MNGTVANVRPVTVLGATGSIGCSTLDVLRRHPDQFSVFALTAHTQVERLRAQCLEFAPRYAVMADAGAARALTRQLGSGATTEVLSGAGALEFVAGHAASPIVMAGIVGAAGLAPVRAAIRAGKRVLLANKEPLVMAGEIVMREARGAGAELLPIDSEHNAVFQCMPSGYRAGERGAAVRRIMLTCSGGPFLNHGHTDLARVTPEEACRHPRWSMGPKISVDSATLMNKGLEVIEACRLFNLLPDQVEIVIHPQSVVHSLVDYEDGSVLAQLGNPDMRTPIAHALGFPQRLASGVTPLDLATIARLEFQTPDRRRFPCLDLAFGAARAGGTIPAVLNAANEVAVQAFLDRRIGFTDIAAVIEHTLDRAVPADGSDIESVLAADAWARAEARRYAAKRQTATSRKAS